MKCLTVFISLQVLDVLTTLLGFKLGAVEASPVIRWVMTESSAVAGLAGSKLAAAVLASICVWMSKPHLIRRINYWYAALIIWNISVILSTRGVH
jgi:hypothetical protein